MSQIQEKYIRKLAHQIWESEGRPNGQHERHWQMACALASAVANVARSGAIASRRVTLPGAAAKAKAAVAHNAQSPRSLAKGAMHDARVVSKG